MSGSTSTPLSTMKSIPKRFYSALGSTATTAAASRVRSSSVTVARSLYTSTPPLAFFDGGPPPTSRPGNVLSHGRIHIEGRAEVETGHGAHQPHPTFSLALINPILSSSSPPLVGPHAFFPKSAISSTSCSSSLQPSEVAKQPKQRYQLDVGAYGIPKKCRHIRGNNRFMHTTASSDANLAVQVGEDAYFVRDNALGVADGVGGWGRLKNASANSPTPSALFARRLMHFCSDEVSTSSSPPSTSTPWYWTDDPPEEPSLAEMQEDLEGHLEELEEGIDVLMILERAYERTLKAHVQPPPPPPPETMKLPLPPPFPPRLSHPPPIRESEPLLAGSSTALLAVLDHVPHQTPSPSDDPPTSYDAVIKIAHIGDCMGMLIRDNQVEWRSEEMWWSFNTPVQLGPSASITPATSAHVFTLPVQADDILILASDGLSDNLWDEDILDEVVRFRQSYLPSQQQHETAAERILWRRTLAGMLSEALCSRARRVSEGKGESEEDEIPFAVRAKENGRVFRGGKNDDISVVVAVISPVADLASS